MVDKKMYAQRLKKIYYIKYGDMLSDAEALDLFEKLVALVEATYPPHLRKYGNPA